MDVAIDRLSLQGLFFERGGHVDLDRTRFVQPIESIAMQQTVPRPAARPPAAPRTREPARRCPKTRVGLRVAHPVPIRHFLWSFHDEAPRPRRGHRRRRPDRLRPALSHRLGRDARQGPAGHPAAARGARREAAEGAEGRDDGDRRLRVPAARRDDGARRPDDRVQGRRLRPARRLACRARPGMERKELLSANAQIFIGAGQGAQRRRLARRQGAGRRQSGQHQRLHRDEERARPAAQELHGDAAPRPQPRREPDRRQDRQAGRRDREARRLGQPLADDVRRLPLRDDRRQAGQADDRRRRLEQGRLPADRRQARRGDHRGARPVVGGVGRQRGDRPHARLGARHATAGG